uniref:DED domain-containing protein n=1 Tax=Heterorhabditis bacteriophora TaxID=37862 RepID=A0A1I7X6X6_HETBA
MLIYIYIYIYIHEFSRFLSSLGLVKKTLPDDGNTLFRALCEKVLSMNQCEFAEIRRLVEDEIEVAYQLLKIRGNLDRNFSDETDILQTLTRLLRVNLIIYREVGKDPIIIQGDEKADGKKSISTWKPPFPFSAVKSLDPAIYRNVAFDIFTKKRKLGNEKKAIAMVNSQSVRFRPGSYCLTRDGEKMNKVRVVARPGPDQRIIRTETGLEKLVSVSDLRSCGQSSANYHSIIPLPTSPPRPLMATDLPPPISLPIPMFGVVPTLSMPTLPPNPVTPSSIVPCISQPYPGITSPPSVPLFDANVPPPRVMPHPSAPSCTWWEQARPLSCFTTTVR